MAKDAKWYAGWVRNAYAQTAEEKQTNLEASDFIEYLAAELEAVRRERDALRYDLLHLACDCIPACSICKHYTIGTEMCPHVKEIGAQDIDDCFEWRGLCKENGGATDE